MQTKLKDVLEIFSLEGFKIIAGHEGIDRPMSRITVMDAPDSYKWISGGEFVMTTGYILKNDDKGFLDIVKKLEKKGAAGLGIKLKRFIKELPISVYNYANENNFTIIEIPMEYSFFDIMNPVLSKIINDQALLLQYSEKIHRSFTEIVINGGTLQEIIDTLKSILYREIAYVDLYFDQYYFSCFDDNSECVLRQIELEHHLNQFENYPIIIDERTYGYLLLGSDKDSYIIKGYSDVALEHAATVLKFQIQKMISNFEIESRYRFELLRDLIVDNFNSEDELRNRAALYDWKLTNNLVIINMDIDNFKEKFLKMDKKFLKISLEETRRHIFNLAKKMMKDNFSETKYLVFSDDILFFIDSDEYDKEKIRRICDETRNRIKEQTQFTLTIGIGNKYSSIMETSSSYNDSLKAVKFGRSIYKKNKTIFYDELGAFSLLGTIYNQEASLKFCNEYLGKILIYDKKHQSELLNTLSTLMDCDWNLKRASSELFIHYNTMKYRYAKICDLIDMDLKNSEVRLNISLSLKILKMQ